MNFRVTRSALFLAPALAFALAACGADEEKTTYEAGATDVSGGELTVTEQKPGEVKVDVPDVAMTPVPDATIGTTEVAAEATPTPH